MTAHPLLLKGFEVELFTGRSNGANVGVAPDVARELPGFVTEPDRRNLEYVTETFSAAINEPTDGTPN